MFAFLTVSVAYCESRLLKGVVLDENRIPVSNAIVDAIPRAPRAPLPELWAPLATTRTSGEGDFSLLAPEGPIELVAYAPGFRRTRFSIPPAAAGRRLAIQLTAGASIEGFVATADGDPLGDVRIGPVLPADSSPQSDYERHVPYWTVSGADGRFRIDGLIPDLPVVVAASGDGLQTSVLPGRAGGVPLQFTMRRGGSTLEGVLEARRTAAHAFAGLPILMQAQDGTPHYGRANGEGRFAFAGIAPGRYVVSPVAGTTQSVRAAVLDFPAHSGTTLTLAIGDGYTIAGRVLDRATSAPIANASLLVQEEPVTADAEGRFRTPLLWRTGEVAAVAGPTGLLSVAEVFDPVTSASAEADGFDDLEDVIVYADQLVRLTFEVVLADGSPAPDASAVSVQAPASASPRAKAHAETADAVATATVARSPLYHAVAQAGGRSLTSEVTTISAEQLRAGDPAARLVLGPAATLQVAPRIADRPPTYQPVLEVRLLTSVDAAEATELMSVTARLDGEWFEIPSLPPGRLAVQIDSRSGGQQQIVPVELRAGETTRIEPVWQPGNTLRGTVTGPEGVRLTAAASVRYFARGRDGQPLSQAAATDGRGAFFFADLPADRIERLLVEAPEYHPLEVFLLDLPSSVALQLTRAAQVSALVEIAEPGNWNVALILAQAFQTGSFREQRMGRVMDTATAPSNEPVRLRISEPGRYVVMASRRGDGAIGVSEPFEWSRSATEDRVVTVQPGATGSLAVDLQGFSAGDTVVSVLNTTLPDGTPGMEQEAPAQNGRVQFSGLIAGDYFVAATTAREYGGAENVEVRPNETVRVTVRPERPLALRGRTTAGGRALSGATVELLSQTDALFSPRSVRSGGDGSFRFDGLFPDLYTLRASSNGAEAQLGVALRAGADPAPVTIDLSAPVTVRYTPPADAGVVPGAAMLWMERASGRLIPARWTEEGALEAELRPGEHELWREDIPTGLTFDVAP